MMSLFDWYLYLLSKFVKHTILIIARSVSESHSVLIWLNIVYVRSLARRAGVACPQTSEYNVLRFIDSRFFCYMYSSTSLSHIFCSSAFDVVGVTGASSTCSVISSMEDMTREPLLYV